MLRILRLASSRAFALATSWAVNLQTWLQKHLVPSSEFGAVQ